MFVVGALLILAALWFGGKVLVWHAAYSHGGEVPVSHPKRHIVMGVISLLALVFGLILTWISIRGIFIIGVVQ